MIFEFTDSLDRNERVFKLTITNDEMMRCGFQPFDRLLLTECEASSAISDKLLALETIARRVEESSPSAASQRTEEPK